MVSLHNKYKLKTKGQVALGQAPGAIQILLVIGIFLAVGTLIVDNVRTQVISDQGLASADVTTDAALNVTNNALGGFDTFGGFLGLIALVVAAAIILGLVRVFG